MISPLSKALAAHDRHRFPGHLKSPSVSRDDDSLGGEDDDGEDNDGEDNDSEDNDGEDDDSEGEGEDEDDNNN